MHLPQVPCVPEDSGVTVTRIGFVPHTLTEDPDKPGIVFRARCLEDGCGESSEPSDGDREPVELWALAHTGRTAHQSFEEVMTRRWRVQPSA